MKYVILIHSNPQPWGHPTGDFVAEAQARPQEEREAGGAAFDAMLEELPKSGELRGAEAVRRPPAAESARRARGGARRPRERHARGQLPRAGVPRPRVGARG